MLNLTAMNQQAKTAYPDSSTADNQQLIDIELNLIQLLNSEQWSAEQLSFFHGWMKKNDVAKQLYGRYQKNWKMTAEKPKAQIHVLQLTILIALNYIHGNHSDSVHAEQILKTANVLFKTLDRIDTPVFGVEKSTIESALLIFFTQHVIQKRHATEAFNEAGLTSATLPITVLFSEGPIARAYLAAIHALGFKVAKIIKLVSSIDLISKKPVGRMLPRGMRINYAANKQYKQMSYWTNVYLKTAADQVQMIREQVHTQLGFAPKHQSEASQDTDLSTYSDQVEPLFIEGLKDPALKQKLESEHNGLFLFTGGGIVPDHLLNINDKKLIHIHPGYLPEIRGADCVLWSQILTGRLSATAFFLAPVIDVGDVITPCWLPDVVLNFPQDADSRVKYRLIYGFLDPWVRAYVLKQLIFQTDGLLTFDATAQQESDGMTYHFMHETTKQMAFDNFKS